MLVNANLSKGASRLVSVAGLWFALPLALASVSASACSPVLPPVEEAVKDVATTGYVISGTVIQAFDAAKRQPEIIRADQIFVGEGKPREFKIYRTERDYESRLKPQRFFACQGRALTKEGFKWERFALIPAPKQADGSSDGQWELYWNDGAVTFGKGYEMLLDEAKRLGRLQERPPVSQFFQN